MPLFDTIFGSGLIPSTIAYIGERPGWDEHKTGRPFTGKSGEVLWQMSWREANLSRDEVWVGNLVPTWSEDNEAPSDGEIAIWGPRLVAKLNEVKPQYLVTLGRYSTRYFLNDSVTMDAVHGQRHEVDAERWAMAGGLGDPPALIPVFHPAAGLHKSEMLAKTAEGMAAMGKIVRGSRDHDAPVDIHAGAEHYGELETWPENLGRVRLITIDTEGSVTAPWSIQITMREGQAFLIRATNRPCLAAFNAWLLKYRPILGFHHSLHDIPVCRALGITAVDELPMRDSILMAYNDTRLPRGLKPLARRLCGMQMTDYADVVQPVEEAKWRDYVSAAVEQFTAVEPVLTKSGKPSKTRDGILKTKSVCSLPGNLGLKMRNMLKPSKAEEPKLLKVRWAEHKKEITAAIQQVEEWCPPPVLEMDDIDPAIFLRYACRDSDATMRVMEILDSLETSHTDACNQDHATIPMLVRMESTGLPVDLERAAQVRAEFEQERDGWAETARLLVGKDDFKVSSPQQVEWHLFQNLGMVMPGKQKLTKSKERNATDDSVLKTLKTVYPEEPFLDTVVRYREAAKMVDFAVDIQEFARGSAREGYRLYPRLRNTSIPSGRLAAYDPNVLAFPAKTKAGQKIRSCIVAPEGQALGSWDFSQIELRVLAHESQDERLMKVFIDGADMHTRTAAAFFGKREEDVDPLLERYPIKTCNYLVVYGGGPDKLLEELIAAGITRYNREDCVGILQEWFRLYSGVDAYCRAVHAEIRRTGYAEDMWGRRRYLPGVSLEGKGWPFGALREEAGRQGVNHRIQGGAQGLLKRAQMRVWSTVLPILSNLDLAAGILLQVHDELISLHDADAWDILNPLMVEAMTDDQDLFTVPICTEGKQARTWDGLK